MTSENELLKRLTGEVINATIFKVRLVLHSYITQVPALSD
ncbi:hypothetical protein FDG75_02170 [Clostridium botulinum]|nr:hypothetical protein [Clostridium botulinum]NFQ08412.1 hypothetical protein [Clostridium botulinum]